MASTHPPTTAASGVDPLTIRIPDVAEALRVSERTVYELIQTQRLPAYKLRSATVVRMEDLLAFVASLPPVRSAV
jgi:excisionase family DNA binding protein